MRVSSVTWCHSSITTTGGLSNIFQLASSFSLLPLVLFSCCCTCMAKYDDVLYTSTNQPTVLRGVAERIRKDGCKVYDARIGYASGKNKHIGTFWTAEAAALAWDVEARLKRGKEALTNFPEEYAATRGSPWAFKVPANKAEAARMLEFGSTQHNTATAEGSGGTLWRPFMFIQQEANIQGGDEGRGCVDGGLSSPDSSSAHHAERKWRLERRRSSGLFTSRIRKGHSPQNLAGDKVPRKVRTRDRKRKVDKATAGESEALLHDDSPYRNKGEGHFGSDKSKQGGGNDLVKGAGSSLLEDHKKRKIKNSEKNDNWGSGGARVGEGKVGVCAVEGGRGGKTKSTRHRKRVEKKYKGITKRFTAKGEMVWHVQIVHQGKCLHLGTVRDPLEGAVIWDAKARELRGVDTETNFPLGFVPSFLESSEHAHRKMKAAALVGLATATRKIGSDTGCFVAKTSQDKNSNRNNITDIGVPEAHNLQGGGMARAEESEGGSQYWENGGHAYACNHPSEDGDEEVTGGCGRAGNPLSAVKEMAIAGVVKDSCGVSGISERKGEGIKGSDGRKTTGDMSGCHHEESFSLVEEVVAVEGNADKVEEEQGKVGGCEPLGKEEGEEEWCFSNTVKLREVDRNMVNGGKEGLSKWWEAGGAEDKWEQGNAEIEGVENRALYTNWETVNRGGVEDGGIQFNMTKHAGVFEKQLDSTTRAFEVVVGLGSTKKQCLEVYETEAKAHLVFETEQQGLIEHMTKRPVGGISREGQGKLKRFKLLSSLP